MLEYLKKNNQNKKRPSTQRYKRLNSDGSQNHHLFINDFIKRSNNNNENNNIKESIPDQMKQNYINVKYNPYSEKKNNNINQSNKKNQRDLSAVANPIMSKLFNKNPNNRIRTGENNNNISADVPRNKIHVNKSNPRYKKINYVEAYKKNFYHDNNYEQNYNMKYHGNRNYNNQFGNKIGERIDVSSDQIRNNPNYNHPYNRKKNNFNQTNLNYNVNKSNIEHVNNSTRYNFHKNRSNIQDNNNIDIRKSVNNNNNNNNYNDIRSSMNNNYNNMINNSNFNNNNRQNFQNNNNYNYNKGNMNNNNVGNNKPHNSNMNFNNNKQNMNLNYNNNIIYNNNKNEFNNIKNNINQYNNNKKNNYNNQTNINKNIINNIPNNQKPYNQNKNYPNNNIYNNNSQNNIYYNNNQNNIYNNNNQNNIHNHNNQNNIYNNNNQKNIYNNNNHSNIYNSNNQNTKYYNNQINNNPNNNKIPNTIYNQNQNINQNNINNNNNPNNNNPPIKLFSNFSYFEDPNISNREKMEDFHTIIPQLTSNPPIAYFAIFDGHSGDQPARYCKENLHKILLKNLNLTKFNYHKSLSNSFQEIDNEISNKNFPNESGTTATVILIYQKYNNQLKKNEKFITCANVGDSKCYLIKQNSLIKISEDHNCNDKKEVDRIKKKGGMVFSGRVFGSLMLTRSIGDREMKNYGVSSIPSINTFKISFDEVFIIIASDGVWDVVNEESLFNVCKENLNCEDLSKKIIQLSLEYDSTDNVSCVVVKL